MNISILGVPIKRYTFSYAQWKTATVTVYAYNMIEAIQKARDVMDRRFAKRDLEPPVGWTFDLISMK